MNITIDNCKRLKISDLKKNGSLDKPTFERASFSWGEKGEIEVIINTIDPEKQYIFFDYVITYLNKKIQYEVRLVKRPTNLGFEQWFFVCPASGELCRKLYLYDGYFVGRKSIKGAVYSAQIRSKKYRMIEKAFGILTNRFEEKERVTFAKFRKHHYKGKETKHYAQWLKIEDRRYSEADIYLKKLEIP